MISKCCATWAASIVLCAATEVTGNAVEVTSVLAAFAVVPVPVEAQANVSPSKDSTAPQIKPGLVIPKLLFLFIEIPCG